MSAADAGSGANYQAHIAAKLSMDDQSHSPAVASSNIGTSGDFGASNSSLQNLGPQVMTAHKIQLFGEGQDVGGFLQTGGFKLISEGESVLGEQAIEFGPIEPGKLPNAPIIEQAQGLGDTSLSHAVGIAHGTNLKLPTPRSTGQEQQH